MPESKLKLLPSILLIVSTFIFPLLSGGQSYTPSRTDSLPTTYTDISKTGLVKPIQKTVSSVFIGSASRLPELYSQLDFYPGIRYKGNVPAELVTKKLILKFHLCNTADTTVSAWFFPGYYYTGIQLYQLDKTGLTEIPAVLPDMADRSGFRLLTLPAKDSLTVIAELRFLKTYINSIRPRLIHADYADRYIAELRNNESDDSLVSYLFCGLMLMMVLFSLTNFLQQGNREFLYYSGYAFFLGFMLFTKALFNFRYSEACFFFESYLDFILQGAGIIFYMIFMQQFLDTKNKYPFLYKLYTTGIILLVLSLLGYSFLHYFSNNYGLENAVENSTKLFLLLLVIIFLVYSLGKWKDKLLRYLFWGNLCLLIFSMISQAKVLQPGFLDKLPGVFSSSIFYYELGLFLELFFFMAGLNYKNRSQIIAQTKERESLKAQNQLQEYEKEIAIYRAQQEERQRISEDMHDELGSGMTAIRLMSEIARNKMKDQAPVELEKISASADDVLNKMNAIIWSMNSGNDTLDNLISYIRSWSQEYLENTPVTCKVNTPVIIRDKELSGDKRRNIFLCVKETLNNILKHSKASRVTITIEAHENLRIEMADNGVGIDMEKIRQFGNGLKNIRRRMESIHGHFRIENRNGTVTTLELPL